MRTFYNSCTETRIWSDITTADDRTLELEPGAEADLSLPKWFEDPWLKPTSERDTKTPPKILTPDIPADTPADPPASDSVADPKE